MDLRDGAEEARFRRELREWLEQSAEEISSPSPTDGVRLLVGQVVDEGAIVARSKAWQRRLHDAGFAAITWPEEYGGRSATPTFVLIYAEETSRFRLPPNIFAVGIGIVGPALMQHGTDSQRARFLPRILDGSEVWCQLWSEPNAGSDLASLKSRARYEPNEGTWIAHGQKVWTSGAHYSDWGMLLARTDDSSTGPRGISCFAVDMRSPGIDIRPLRQMTGSADFNEVFLTDVRIPEDHMIGTNHDGWRVAMTALSHERHSAVLGLYMGSLWQPLRELFRRISPHSGRLRQRLADAYVHERLVALTGFRLVCTQHQDANSSLASGALTKLVSSRHLTEVSELARSILGIRGQGWTGPDDSAREWSDLHLLAPGMHIAGGTDDIMRNTIAERGLRLPREPG